MKLTRVIYPAAIIIIFALLGYLFNSLSNLRTLVEDGNRESIINTNLDFFLGKIDSNFTITLTTITVICGFFLILNFAVMHEYINHKVKKWDEKIDSVKNSLNIHIDRIKSLEGDMSFDFA